MLFRSRAPSDRIRLGADHGVHRSGRLSTLTFRRHLEFAKISLVIRTYCGQDGWDADDKEIQSPPTTHFVATVDDLTDMLDFDSEDIDGMDADAGEDQEPAPIGHWKATSSYDIYMVDTPKDGDGDGTVGDDAPKNSKAPASAVPL